MERRYPSQLGVNGNRGCYEGALRVKRCLKLTVFLNTEYTEVTEQKKRYNLRAADGGGDGRLLQPYASPRSPFEPPADSSAAAAPH